MKILSAALILFTLSFAHAEEKIKAYFNNEDLAKVIEVYSKASGQKFVIDSSVRGKISIFNQEPISTEEFFNQLSSALALNGFAVSKQDGVMIIRNARSTQRDYIQVSTERPSISPERMYTWIYTVKNMPVQEFNSQMRILTSSYGEITLNDATNQVIVTDFTSSINRVADIFKELDVKPTGDTAKLAQTSKKIHEERSTMLRKEAHNEKPTAKQSTEIKEVKVEKKDE